MNPTPYAVLGAPTAYGFKAVAITLRLYIQALQLHSAVRLGRWYIRQCSTHLCGFDKSTTITSSHRMPDVVQP
eukprot:2829666-Prymnesium_polylepis.2